MTAKDQTTYWRSLVTQEAPLNRSKPLVLLNFASTRVGTYPLVLILDKELFDGRLAHAAGQC